MEKIGFLQRPVKKQQPKSKPESNIQEITINEQVEAGLQGKVAVNKKAIHSKITVFTVNDSTLSILIQEVGNKPESHLTTFEKMELVRTGISKKGLEQLKLKTTLDYDKFARMLSTTKATLINKKGDEKFSSSLSEKILSVADVYSYGYEVFEDADKFNSWMLSPIRALGGKAPYEIMNNQFGREEVRNIIGRIAYGVFS